MSKPLNQYLEEVEKYLRPLPVAERIDIAAEIKGEMVELQEAGHGDQEILTRLGSAKDLAKAYLGEAITKGKGFSLSRLGALAVFYSLAGAAWVIVLPVTGIIGVSFMACGVLAPLAGLVKFLSSLIGIELPWIVVQFGSYIPGPAATLLYSVFMGGLLFLLGRSAWMLTLWMVRKISATKKKIER